MRLRDLKQFRLEKPGGAGELFSNIERLLGGGEMSSALCVSGRQTREVTKSVIGLNMKEGFLIIRCLSNATGC